MVIYLIRFKVKKIHGLNEKQKRENKEVTIYAGLNFLLTRTATENYFDLYKTQEGNNIVQIPSPIDELKKYDIYRWGERYINSPVLIEKCNDSVKLPEGKEQELTLVDSNNYKPIYSSNTKDNIYYVGYSNSCDTYCPYNQMGKNKKNKDNRSICIYYNVNERGHRNLKGEHPSWVETHYMKPPPFSFYHLKKNEYKESDGGDIKYAFYQDDKGIIYYPVGSVWTARLNKQRLNRNDFSPMANNKSSGHSGFGPEKETILLSGNLLPPVDYKKIWNSHEGNHGCHIVGQESITIWEPVPPSGYVVMGHIVSTSDTKEVFFKEEEENDANDANREIGHPIYCVPESCVIRIPIGPKIWDSEKLIKKDFGKNTFTPADKFILDLNCYLKESTQRSKSDIITKLDAFMVTERAHLTALKKNTTHEYCQVDIEYLIQELSNLREIDAIKNWNSSNTISIYNGVNSIRNLAKEIEEKYQVRYSTMKDMVLKDIKKLDDKITPHVKSASPVYIFSAGADKAYEEALNMPGLKIDDDNGHNLFFACTSLEKAPKFAYKLNKACLYKPKIKPIKLETVPGVLDLAVQLEADAGDRSNSKRIHGKSSEQYFTFPKDLILENLSSVNSPTTEPKRYYLSFSNKPASKEDGVPPLYFIRAVNIKTKEFSLCKTATMNEKIIDTEMDTSNENSLFIIECDRGNGNEQMYRFLGPDLLNNVRLRIKNDTLGEKKYFDQFYTEFGRNEERLTNDGSYNFKLKRVG